MIENGGRYRSIWQEALLTYWKCKGHLRDKDTLSLHLPINRKFAYININDKIHMIIIIISMSIQ